MRNKNKTASKSKNLYMQLLVKVSPTRQTPQLFRFLSRRTESGFSKTVLRRLVSSRTARPPVSISKLAKNVKDLAKTAVVVGTVTDDMRALKCPKLTVAAIRFTETARARIVAAGGVCLTLDELVMKNPTGSNTVLLRGSTDREAKSHFGAAGTPHSHVKPYCYKGKEKKTGLS